MLTLLNAGCTVKKAGHEILVLNEDGMIITNTKKGGSRRGSCLTVKKGPKDGRDNCGDIETGEYGYCISETVRKVGEWIRFIPT
jgi:hypothetical protein